MRASIWLVGVWMARVAQCQCPNGTQSSASAASALVCFGHGVRVSAAGNGTAHCQCWSFPTIYEQDGSPSSLSPDPCCFGTTVQLVPGLLLGSSLVLVICNGLLACVVAWALCSLCRRRHELGARFRVCAFVLILCWCLCVVAYFGVDPYSARGWYPPFVSLVLSLLMDPPLATANIVVFAFLLDLTSKTLHMAASLRQRITWLVAVTCPCMLAVLLWSAATDRLAVYFLFWLMFLPPFSVAFLYSGHRLTQTLRHPVGLASPTWRAVPSRTLAARRIMRLCWATTVICWSIGAQLIYVVVRGPQMTARQTVYVTFVIRLLSTVWAALIVLTFWRPHTGMVRQATWMNNVRGVQRLHHQQPTQPPRRRATTDMAGSNTPRSSMFLASARVHPIDGGSEPPTYRPSQAQIQALVDDGKRVTL